MSALRSDLARLCEWIEPGSRVLDVGCGDGALLAHLAATRNVRGYGVEIDDDHVATCIDRGVNVIQSNVDDGLRAFGDQSFDYVLMTQALQALRKPEYALGEIVRVGRTGILTFPNFGHWRVRLSLMRGRTPVTPALPTPWYATENIHLCTVRDFDELLLARGWRCLRRDVVDNRHRDGPMMKRWPNLFGEIAIYMLSNDEAHNES